MSAPTTNQIQLGVVFAAHYTATRMSVEGWVSRRDQYLSWFVVGAFANVGFFLSGTSHDAWALYLVAPASVIVLFAYVSADMHVAYLCKWLKKEYSKLLNTYCTQFEIPTYEPWHWDNSLSVKKYYNEGAALFRYVAILLAFCGMNIVAFSVYYFQTHTTDILLTWGSACASLIAAVVTVYVYITRARMALT